MFIGEASCAGYELLRRTSDRLRLPVSDLDAAVRGDYDAAASFMMAASAVGSTRHEQVRAWFIGQLYRRHGASPALLALLKQGWYGAQDFIGFTLGVEGLKDLGRHEPSIEHLPPTFRAYRAEWRKPRGFISPVYSWALAAEQVDAYLDEKRVLISRQVDRLEMIFRIPASEHSRLGAVDEIVLPRVDLNTVEAA